MKVGLVLSGGGARGFAHLGVLKALEEREIPVSAISGSSAGALVGSLFAYGYTPDEIYKIIVGNGVGNQLKISWSKSGLFSFDKIEKLFLKYLPDNSFESLKIPLFVCATDIENAHAVYFSEGELIKPICASCAIPGIFSPVKIKNKTYVDGGVIDNLPIDPIINITDYKIGVNIMPLDNSLPIKSASNILLKSLLIAVGEKSALKEPLFDLIIKPEGIGTFNGYNVKQAKDLYELGYKSTREKLLGVSISNDSLIRIST